MQIAQLCEQGFQLDSSMARRVGLEATDRLCELAFHSDGTAATGLVPGDGDVHEPLQEVPLVRRRRPPRVLESLVRREVLSGADQLEASLKS